MRLTDSPGNENGLHKLASRFKTDAGIPIVPDAAIFEEFNEAYKIDRFRNDKDWKYWNAKYPLFDSFTAQALDDKSDYDRFPKYIMFAYGNYFVSRSWTDSELHQYKQTLCRILDHASYKSKAVAPGANMTCQKKGRTFRSTDLELHPLLASRCEL